MVMGDEEDGLADCMRKQTAVELAECEDEYDSDGEAAGGDNILRSS